jgi:hypothetical protein
MKSLTKQQAAGADVAHGRTHERASVSSVLRSVLRDRAKVAVAVLLLLAFTLRTWVYFEAPRPFDGAGLAAEQGEMARNIVDHGRWFVVNREATDLVTKLQIREKRLVDPAHVDFSSADRKAKAQPAVDQMPGVAVILAGIWWVTGHESYAPLQWLQLLLDAAMVLLLYWIAMRLARSTRVAILAALLYALWPGAIVVAKRPSPDTWAGFFAIGCVAAFVWARERPTSRFRLVVLGLLTGVGIYFRPFIVAVPIALALVATPEGGWRRRFIWMAAPTAVALLVLAPWTIRNYYEFDAFIPTRTGLGQAIFEGTGHASLDSEAAQHVHRHRADATYGSPAYDDFLFDGSVRAIAADPGYYLDHVRPRVRFLVPCLLVVFLWRRWRSAALILAAAGAAIVAPYLLIGDDTRFYLPAASAYIVLCAMTAELALAFMVGSKPWRRLRGSMGRRGGVTRSADDGYS